MEPVDPTLAAETAAHQVPPETSPPPGPYSTSALELPVRIYLYVIAAISLALLGIGLANLLELAFTRLAASWNGFGLLVGGAGDVRRQVSVYVAITLVALPIWMLHWGLAERAARHHEAERGSTVRALYLAVGLAIPLVYLILSVRDLMEWLALRAAGVDDDALTRRSVAEALALLFVAGAILAYHSWVRMRDERAGIPERSAIWPLRLYLYGAAFAGLMLLLTGVVDLIGVTIDALFDPGAEIVRSARWWAPALADGVAVAVAGFLVWGIHWGYALHRIELSGWRGESERRSTLRRLYLYLAAFTGIVLALVTVVRILDALFQAAMGIYPSNSDSLGQRLVESLARLVPFSLLWLYHRRRVVAEAAQVAEVPLQAGIRRIYTYGAALIGLLFAAIGAARLVTLVILVLGDGSGKLTNAGNAWRDEVSLYAAIAITGAAAWLWHWYIVQGWLSDAASGERKATTRRVYLFVTLGASVVAVLAGLSVILYNILSSVLAVEDRGNFVSDVAGAAGATLIASAILLYHGLTLRSDLRAQTASGPSAATMRLTLSGPPGADLDAVVDALRPHLADGYELNKR